MTENEKIEAFNIIKKYDLINKKLDQIISSLNRLERKKSETLGDLQRLRDEEIRFLSNYKKRHEKDESFSFQDLINLLK